MSDTLPPPPSELEGIRAFERVCAESESRARLDHTLAHWRDLIQPYALDTDRDAGAP